MTGLHYLFFFQLAAGSILMLPLLPREKIGTAFFKAIASGCFVVTLAGLVLLGLTDAALALPPAIAAGALLGYIVTVRPARTVANRALHLLATAGLFVAAVVQPTVEHWAAGPGWYVLGGSLLSALSMGSIVVVMILGHWYLALRHLPFSYLRNLVFAAIAFVVANGLIQGGYLASHTAALDRMLDSDAMGFVGSGELLLFMRWLFGIVGPAVLLFMAWRCIQIRSNQSATGILYVVTVFVLLGEFTAGLLA